MIKIENINKYFNRYKKNQIHVIDNTSLTLGDTGLVALLGPSGSGKTTLLNVIGGLDKVQKGKIFINDQKITSKFSYKVDKIRNLNIGYIFQDYKLVDNLSVYDNVALSLKIIGIKDKKEIDKRVTYVLEKVGMYRYRKRPANMLSGGERQRVGIARAIVKNPNIIIADEPTGNLDSKNSVEIMNIIKAISKDRLVILVTHETNLANFYASRIIEISDGKVIKDYENTHTNELDYAIDNRFYLKDFKKEENFKDKTNDITIYHDNNEKLQVEIVIRNNNIYIRSKNNNSIEVVDEDSSIEFIDDHYHKLDKSELEKYEFDFENIIDKNRKLKYSSIFNPLTFITNGFRKVFSYSLIKKILLFGFFLSGIFIMISTSTLGAASRVNEKEFVKTNKNYITIEAQKTSLEEYKKYSEMPGVKYIIPSNSNISMRMPLTDYYQTSGKNMLLKGSLSSLNMITKDDLIYGRMPENNQEIVVDKLAIEKMFSSSDNVNKMANLKNVKDVLNRVVTITSMDDFHIVGITDLTSPSIYANEEIFTDILYNTKSVTSEYAERNEGTTGLQDYELFKNKITITKGRAPTNDYETIVNASNKEEMKLNKEISTKVGERKLVVVGYYTSADELNNYFINRNTIKNSLILKAKAFTIYPDNKTKVLKDFRSNYEINIYDSYENDRDNYIASRAKSNRLMLAGAIIVLSISLIEIFLMTRSSFLSRVKEVGVYRAIGVKKKDIYIMFSGEIIAITTLTSLLGILICAYIMKVITNVPSMQNIIMVNIKTVVEAIIICYGFNLLVGLIPVFATLRKTPAAILARTDLD
ncbi:MAG: ABC transporter ATP-binding protein/permease [Tenericutes bacterium]|nr:ABC transporter ATP-binding protein/permease [Mycoplasmatota bacterium]